MSVLTILGILIVAFLAGVEGVLEEFQFHQPLVACTLIGIVSGCVREGILLGGSLQMMALGWANVGASVAPDVALASVASSILMVHGLHSTVPSEYVISLSIAIAIPLSVIGLFLTRICRTKAVSIVKKMDQAALQADFKAIERYQISGIVMQGARVMIPSVFLVAIPSVWIVSLVQALPLVFLEGLNVARGLIPSLGFAIVINVLASKETWAFFALGFSIAGISSLSLIGIFILGASLMLIYIVLKKGEEDTPDKELHKNLKDVLNS